MFWAALSPKMAGALSILGVVVLVVGLAYCAGRGAKEDEINAENTAAGNAAIEASTNRLTCNVNGGMWDFSTSKCKRP